MEVALMERTALISPVSLEGYILEMHADERHQSSGRTSNCLIGPLGIKWHELAGLPCMNVLATPYKFHLLQATTSVSLKGGPLTAVSARTNKIRVAAQIGLQKLVAAGADILGIIAEIPQGSSVTTAWTWSVL